MRVPEWLEIVRREYLADYVSRGGATVKFAVPADGAAGRERCATALSEAATEQGFLVATVDSRLAKIHLVDQLFFQVARQRQVQLRRRKAGVLPELPPKTGIPVRLQLDGGQRQTYDQAEREGVLALRRLGSGLRIEHVLELLVRLKQICNVCPRTGESAKLADLSERLETLECGAPQWGNRGATHITMYTGRDEGALCRRNEQSSGRGGQGRGGCPSRRFVTRPSPAIWPRRMIRRQPTNWTDGRDGARRHSRSGAGRWRNSLTSWMPPAGSHRSRTCSQGGKNSSNEGRQAGLVPTFNERILILADMFERSGTSYAFGGAIAYTYYGEPRVTRDIDINVFVDETNSEPILALLREAGLSFETGEQAALVRRDGQVRIPWDTVPVDLFFSNMPFHDSCRERVHHVPFSGRQITILSPEDLLVCKIAYNREKDWLDIEEIVHTQQTALDLAYIRRWLDTILGSNDGRVERFNQLVT